jgi:hypothetical protein
MRLRLLVLLVFFIPEAKSSNWYHHALKIGGTKFSERQEALRVLKQIPHLDEELLSELNTPRKYRALDVIAALGLQSTLPTLLDLSKADQNGAIYLAINSLLNSQNREKIANTYTEKIRSKASVPCLVVMLDTLGRLGVSLSPSLLSGFLGSSSSDLRSAAVYYLRLSLRQKEEKDYFPLLVTALSDKWFQIRMQAWHTLHDLPPATRSHLGIQRELCHAETHPEVKTTCDRIGETR